MDATAAGGSRELAEYFAMLKRRWWVVSAGAALGIALAGALIIVVPKTYSSFAVVNVTPTNLDSGSQAGRQQSINLQTEAQQVKSFDVASRAGRMLGTKESPAELSSTVSVNVPNNSTVIYVTVNAPVARAARDRAHAFAQAYLDDRRDNATNALLVQAQSLERQVSSLTKRLRGMTDTVQKDLVISQMHTLNNKNSDLRVQAANVNPGEIITDAALPTSPSDPSLTKYLPSGLLAGLLVGVVLAFLLDRTDKRIRTAQDVERVLDLPALLDIPAKRGRDALGLLPARSRTGQSFNELAHVLSATLGHGNHVLLVTGAAPGRGGSVVAANLAAALARTSSEVLLICADMNSSVAGELLGLEEGPGLSELLLGWTDLRDVVRRAHGIPTLSVITAGANAESAAEHLQREQMARLVGSLREKLRFTVIEAPSPELGADAQALADLSDAALIVVEKTRARYVQVRDGVRRIDRMGAAVMGAVVLPKQDGRSPVAPPPAPLPTRSSESSRPSQPPRLPARASSPATTRRDPGDYEYKALQEPPTVTDMMNDDAPAPSKGRHRTEPAADSEKSDVKPSSDNGSEDTAVHKTVSWP